MQAYGELPCGRYRHQAMVKDHTMYIVGGSGINRWLHSLFDAGCTPGTLARNHFEISVLGCMNERMKA